MLPYVFPRPPGGAAPPAADVNGWVRPYDWLPMPASDPHTIDALVAVLPNGGNYFSLQVTVSGGYTVDWGDGTVENVASGTPAYHEYDYDDPLAPCHRLYKMAMVRVYRQNTANNITAASLISDYSPVAHFHGWLDIQVNLPNVGGVNVSGSNRPARLLERVNFVASGSGSASNLFQSAGNVRSVLFHDGYFSNKTNIQNLFYSSLATSVASALRPEAGLGDGNVINFSSTFSGAYLVRELLFPIGTFDSGNFFGNVFAGMNMLRRIQNCAIPLSFSVANASLEGDALDEIFTSLPSVSGQTITITGNPGVGDCDPSIATNKGWTVAT